MWPAGTYHAVIIKIPLRTSHQDAPSAARAGGVGVSGAALDPITAEPRTREAACTVRPAQATANHANHQAPAAGNTVQTRFHVDDSTHHEAWKTISPPYLQATNQIGCRKITSLAQGQLGLSSDVLSLSGDAAYNAHAVIDRGGTHQVGTNRHTEKFPYKTLQNTFDQNPRVWASSKLEAAATDTLWPAPATSNNVHAVVDQRAVVGRRPSGDSCLRSPSADDAHAQNGRDRRRR